MKKLIAIILLIALLIPMGATAEEDTERTGKLYYRFANVIDLEYDTDVVTADDGLGNLWEFFGVDYFDYDDLIIMIMADN